MLKSNNNYTALYLTFTLLWGLCCGFVLLSSAAGTIDSELLINDLFPPGSSWTYKFESSLLLNEKISIDKHVGFKIDADLIVESKRNGPEKLLKLQVFSFCFSLILANKTLIKKFYIDLKRSVVDKKYSSSSTMSS